MVDALVTSKEQPSRGLVAGTANGLDMRVSPDEAVYREILNTAPGWAKRNAASVVVDMSYKDTFSKRQVAGV